MFPQQQAKRNRNEGTGTENKAKRVKRNEEIGNENSSKAHTIPGYALEVWTITFTLNGHTAYLYQDLLQWRIQDCVEGWGCGSPIYVP